MGWATEQPGDIWSLRRTIYDHFAAVSSAPPRASIVEAAGDDADRLLTEMHERRLIVLDGDGSIRMALPFSGVPTAFSVRAADRRWMANCAWDALAIPIVVGRGDPIDAHIDGHFHDTGEPVDLAVVGGRLSHTNGFVHFQVPASQWWADIVHT